MSTATAEVGLTQTEQEAFERDGFLGPFSICPPEEMASIRREIETRVLAGESPFHSHNGQSRHLDCQVVWALCSHPAIVERMAGILGPDLVLWRSNFFVKEPGAQEVPWHQDRNYWPLDPEINLSAWLAIDEATPENSCVQLIPGSHKQVIPHVKSGAEMAFGEMADVRGVDVNKKVNMALKPGEFFLFNETTLHHSDPNRSTKRRMGLAVRVTVPKVKVDHAKLFPGHKVIRLRGEDPYRLNETQAPPTANPPIQARPYTRARKRPSV